MTKKFYFDAFSNPATKEAAKLIGRVHIDREFNKTNMMYQVDLEKNEVFGKVEAYLTEKKIFPVDSYNHHEGVSFRLQGPDCDFPNNYLVRRDIEGDGEDIKVAFLGEHPELLKLFTDSHEVLVGLSNTFKAKDAELCKILTEAWLVIETHLEEKGLISRDEEGAFPDMDLNNVRVVSPVDDEGDFQSGVGAFIKKMLGSKLGAN